MQRPLISESSGRAGQLKSFNDVAVDKLYRITEGSGIAPVTPGAAWPYRCGPPTINGAVDVGVFVWKDCPSGAWRMKTTAGGGSKTYTGVLNSSANFLNVTPQVLEIDDTLDSTTNPSQISYNLITTGNGTDGINFTPQDGAETCMQVNAPVSAQVYFGPFRAPISRNFNLDTLVSCGSLPVELSVAPVSASETDADAIFTVSLSAASTQTVTVDYASANGTAMAGADFTGVTDTLTFAPNETSKTVSVPMLDDALAEGNETFTLTLSNPTNAIVSASTGQATGTIQDNETSPCGAPSYNAGTTAAAFVWRDCATGKWFVRVCPRWFCNNNDLFGYCDGRYRVQYCGKFQF